LARLLLLSRVPPLAHTITKTLGFLVRGARSTEMLLRSIEMVPEWLSFPQLILSKSPIDRD